jgi:hypothetical protein
MKLLIVIGHFGYENCQTNITYTDSTLCFTEIHFNQPGYFHGHPKLYENVQLNSVYLTSITVTIVTVEPVQKR